MAVESDDVESVVVGRQLGFNPVGKVVFLRLCWEGLVGLDGGQDEDAVAPDERRGVALAGKVDFPADILRFAPRYRRVAMQGGSGAQRAAPLRPVVRGVGGLFYGPRHQWSQANTGQEDTWIVYY